MVVVWFSFASTCQVIDWEDRLRYDHNVLSGTLNLQPSKQNSTFLSVFYVLTRQDKTRSLLNSGSQRLDWYNTVTHSSYRSGTVSHNRYTIIKTIDCVKSLTFYLIHQMAPMAGWQVVRLFIVGDVITFFMSNAMVTSEINNPKTILKRLELFQCSFLFYFTCNHVWNKTETKLFCFSFISDVITCEIKQKQF